MAQDLCTPPWPEPVDGGLDHINDHRQKKSAPGEGQRLDIRFGRLLWLFLIQEFPCHRTAGGIGYQFPTDQDCRTDKSSGSYPILDRLAAQSVNLDELNDLTKRLERFDKD